MQKRQPQNPIQKIMEQTGLNAHQIGKRCGFKSPMTVYRHLKNTRSISGECALAYHRLFGTPLSELLGSVARRNGG